jgi:hypothetical protein
LYRTRLQRQNLGVVTTLAGASVLEAPLCGVCAPWSTCPTSSTLPWGAQEPTARNWHRRRFADDDGSLDDGVGVLTSLPTRPGTPETWLAAVSINSKLPEIEELIVAKYGDGPVRVAADGTKLRVFRADFPFGTISLSGLLKDGAGCFVPGSRTEVHIGSNNGIIVLSGTDAGKWTNGNLLTVKRDELPPLIQGTAQALLDDVERLMQRLNLSHAS